MPGFMGPTFSAGLDESDGDDDCAELPRRDDLSDPRFLSFLLLSFSDEVFFTSLDYQK